MQALSAFSDLKRTSKKVKFKEKIDISTILKRFVEDSWRIWEKCAQEADYCE